MLQITYIHQQMSLSQHFLRLHTTAHILCHSINWSHSTWVIISYKRSHALSYLTMLWAVIYVAVSCSLPFSPTFLSLILYTEIPRLPNLMIWRCARCVCDKPQWTVHEWGMMIRAICSRGMGCLYKNPKICFEWIVSVYDTRIMREARSHYLILLKWH